MRELTLVQAADEIQILDRVSNGLRNALRQNYEDLRTNSPAVTRPGRDIEFAARLHNIRLSLNEALEEVGRRGYGRVIFVRQEDEAGNVVKNGIYRVSQANASLPEASIIARNSPLGSQIASCRVGEDLEVRLPGGERYFVVTSLVDIEGAVQLLRPNPDIKLARFQVADDPDVDLIRSVRTFLESRLAPVHLPEELETQEDGEAAASKAEAELARSPSDPFWPSDWSKVVFADEPDAALGAQFFTRTTREQEEAIRTVRGVTTVHGIAGTGKTSVALGRLKFFANFRSGEHLRDYGLNPNDWADFDSSDMIGFVLSPSLVQYLKQTAEDLEMRMKIMDFEEYQNQERQSRRLFGRPYKRSPDSNAAVQQTVLWLETLAEAACLYVAEAMEAALQEPLSKPDTPDGTRTSDARWQMIENQLWRSGPLKARILGLYRGLESGSSGLQGLAASLDRDVRVSDHETSSLNPVERRALREAVLNVSLRFFRLLNPSELYVEVHRRPELSSLLAKRLSDQISVLAETAAQTARRLEERLVTDGDVITALCLNALACDGFERDIREIPYVRTFSDRIGVFIDEYQDFSEQQVFLMGYRAKRKYRQITVAGDLGQQLHAGGIRQISHALPYVSEPVRQIMLDTNFRQSKSLARLSNCFRAFTSSEVELSGEEPCAAPMHVFRHQDEMAEFAAARINALPGAASVVVISPNEQTTETWFDRMAPSLESAFRNPIISDRARLTERLKTHFTTPLQAKGLEFDVAVVPDISEFDDEYLLSLNGLYVGVSRPRHAITLGCRDMNLGHKVVKQLCESGDLVPMSISADEVAA